ncbi:alpha/beta fold hydrolase [Craurococcus roseus]|uniref:alpha/beta fold hydrolase n=1 Tax=Craurococcus roseus TaxID=77585 RepID=UPI0031D819D5
MDERKRVAALIRDYIARERMSREQFAFKAKLGKSTVDKLLTGLFSDKTLAAVEGRTGLQLRRHDAPEGLAAPGRAAPAEAVPRHEVTFHRAPDGVCLAVASAGEGPVVVKTANWLNHLEQDWRGPVWGPLLRRLSSKLRVVRYDGRGNGLSDREVADISFAAFVRDLEAVVDGLGLERFALFGASQGAAIAIAYAAAHPERVSRIVLHGAYAQGRNRRGSEAERELARTFLTMIRQGWGDEHSAFVRAFASIFFPAATPEQLQAWVELQRLATSADTAVRLRAACDEIDVTGLLGAVRAPTLVLHNRHDSVAPLDQARRIAAGIAGAHFVELESDNHVVLEGEAAWPRFIAEIERFLAS